MTQHDEGAFFNFRNTLILLGIIITTVGLIYFATEFTDIISEWGRTISLGLLTVIYVSLGLHFARTTESDALVQRPGWGWLRVATALYLLGLVGGFSTVMSFLFIDEIDRVWKVLSTILLGLVLIVVAARFFGRRHPST